VRERESKKEGRRERKKNTSKDKVVRIEQRKN